MSTKIYNGFEFIGDNDIRSIHRNIREFQEELEPVVNKFLIEFLAYDSVSYYDNVVHLGGSLINNRKEPVWKAHEEYRDRVKVIKDSGLRDPEVDFDFEIVILPIKDKILGIHYTEQGEFKKLLSEKPWFREYGYWDNVDPSEKCTEEEWDKRQNDWDEALPGYVTPAFAGLSVKLTNPNMFSVFPDCTEMFNSLLPSKTRRAKAIAVAQMRKEYFDKETIDLDPETKLSKLSGEQVREVWDKLYDFNTLLKTTLKEKLDNKTIEIEAKLHDLDYNILKNPLEIINK